MGVANIPINLYHKLKGNSNYTLFQTYTTNSLGNYTITTTLDTSNYDFQIIIENLNIQNPNNSDAIHFNQKVLIQNFNSKDFYRMNTNNNNLLTITDVFLIHKKINGGVWLMTTPTYRLFTQVEWNIINTSTSNLISTYPGTQRLILNNPRAGGSSINYLVRTGFSN